MAVELLNGGTTEVQQQALLHRANYNWVARQGELNIIWNLFSYSDSIVAITPNNLLPGALEILKELRQADIKIAIGSTSKNAKAIIKKLGLAKFYPT